MAALKTALAHPAWDLVIFAVVLLVGAACFINSSRLLLVVDALVAIVALKWRLANADRLRADGVRREGVGSKVNQLLSVIALSWAVSAVVLLAVR